MPTATAPASRRSATFGSVARAVSPLLATVRLRDGVAAEGVAVPANAAGTVVEVLARGEAYIVEFFEPRHAVVTVRQELLDLDPR